MKKTLFLFLLLGNFSLAYSLDYTISFYRNVIDSTVCAEMISATDNCVADICYSKDITRSQEGNGIKGGTADRKGAICLKLDTLYHITDMTVYAASYSHKKDSAATKGMIICGDTIYWEAGHRTEIRPYAIDIDTLTDSITLSAIMEKENRWYVQRIVYTAEDPRPDYPKITAPLSVDFGGAKIEEGGSAEDVKDIRIVARNTTDSLRLRLKKSTDFKLETSVLPPMGGDVSISYKVTSKGTKKDVLLIEAIGGNKVKVEYSIQIELYAITYNPTEDPVDSSKMHIGPMPGNYYKPAQGKSDSLLKSALSSIINCGVRYRYGSGKEHSWAGFYYTDRDTVTNQVLDMYSHEVKYFNPSDKTASVQGFDIEHMLPKSWWGGDVNYAYRDLFHLVPANYSANRSKSNHAPGIPADSTFNNGSFVTGSGKTYGLTRVFCPEDEYKGDFARAYFYIVTCYDTLLHWEETGEAAQAMTNTGYLEFRPWLQNLLMTWHRADPVSEKEKARAIEVNKIQGNRNPFIDYPELAEYIWGNKKNQAVDFYKLEQSFGDPYSEETGTSNPLIGVNQDWRKVLVNEQLYIQKNGIYYSVLGL